MNLPQEIHVSFTILKCNSPVHFILGNTILQTAAWINSRDYIRFLKHNANSYFIFFSDNIYRILHVALSAQISFTLPWKHACVFFKIDFI